MPKRKLNSAQRAERNRRRTFNKDAWKRNAAHRSSQLGLTNKQTNPDGSISYVGPSRDI